jgi:hypothetical protein
VVGVGGGEVLAGPGGRGWQRSAIGYQLSAIGYQLSAIGYRLSAIGDRLSAIGIPADDQPP